MKIVLLLTEAEHIAQKKVCENQMQDFLNWRMWNCLAEKIRQTLSLTDHQERSFFPICYIS